MKRFRFVKSLLKPWILLGLPLILFCTFAGKYFLDANNRIKSWDVKKAEKAGRDIPVRTMRVSIESVSETIGATCVTHPSQTAFANTVQPMSASDRVVPITWQVADVLVDEGATLRAGETIVKLNDEVLQLNFREREIALEAARKKVEIFSRLVEKGSANRFELEKAEFEEVQARLALEVVRRQLDESIISSPISGVLEELTVVKGSILATSSPPIATVRQLSPLHVIMDFPIERLGDLDVGLTAEVMIDGFDSEVFTGTVIRVAPIADGMSRVLPVTLSIENDGERLKAGLPGFAKIRLQTTAIKVPATAVMSRGREKYVFAVVQGRTEIRSLELGARDDEGYVLVKNGLQEGDQIVIAGQQGLSTGTQVNSNWQSWANRDQQSSMHNKDVTSAGEAILDGQLGRNE